MSGFLKFLFLCLLAIAAGVAAVSVPIEGKTAAEHVRTLVESATAEGGGEGGSQPKPKPKARAKAEAEAPAASPRPRMARQAPKTTEQAPADDHTEEERRALERLIGEKVR